MSTIDKFRLFSVKVGEGSGCLFQPTSESYTYVLTARHVVEGTNVTQVQRELIGENEVIQIESMDVIGEPYYHANEGIDAAILKVPFISQLPKHLRIDNLFNKTEDYYLCGFPDVRRENTSSYRQNKLSIQNQTANGYVEAEINSSVNHGEIVGQSGGGILKLLNDSFAIGGVQKRMSMPDDGESLSRVDLVPLKAFDEIIGQNIEELSLLFPPFIKSFSNLVCKTYLLAQFPLQDSRGFHLLKTDLHSIANTLCAEFSPEKIMDGYPTNYLLSRHEDEFKNHQNLWTALLEILTLNQIHSQRSLVLDDLPEINKKNKLFFGTVKKNWTELIKDLCEADLSELERGGNVFVATLGDDEPTLTVAPSSLVMSISEVPQSMMSIHNTVQNLAQDIKFKHIYDIQKTIIENLELFIDANMGNIRENIINGTRNII
ncbi:hypothetical protein FGD67_03550 [Colwellia sp. M166]|uniref:ABC-three component system protein n=1 Tax=Colwellia sp. M166 TaxID=2583805 RepID=UPI00211E72AA|nr:ABC-three component system protein [Colwellia sp. M166]UUO22382.1 hypothetical protein FGD67_03550 [Colwellia sp. M166]|tara:strand:- start:17173 stop:18468 length:1296 start_codon:yes stop_codon:yes gene_type:complete